MANIQVTRDNLWAEYYTDDTEEQGFYIDSIYVGTDPARTNIYDWLTDSAIQFIAKSILKDIENKGVWL